eukprot:TRINITY_DN13389_c0_g1_i1.p2 TRINITY_DN13389_c0_g1~~TRINITY_DN13389_c0_g1_i1.p2  ORF type:complete len:58 (-),score=3.31 TRINITY_DN13389_c0_g1_i1:71-244(-)
MKRRSSDGFKRRSSGGGGSRRSSREFDGGRRERVTETVDRGSKLEILVKFKVITLDD